jgi:lysophospholipase L1-like esterase
MYMQIRFFLLLGFLLSAIAGNSQNPVTNQRLFDTIPFLPEYWPTRVAQFESEPIVTGRIIFLGNSITQGWDWKKLLGDSSVINRGIGGDITFGVLKRLDDVIKRNPSKLFVLIGINDIGKDIPDAVIAENVKKIITRVQRECPHTRIYLQSILPLNPDIKGFPQHYDKREHVINTNKLLKKVAEGLSCTYVDLYPLFVDKEGKLMSALTKDGLHLSSDGQGYMMWVEHLRKEGHL